MGLGLGIGWSANDMGAPALGFRVTKTEDLSAAQDDLFTVTGKVLITLLTGEVTNEIGAAVIDHVMRIKTVGTEIMPSNGINGSTVGTIFTLGGDSSVSSAWGSRMENFSGGLTNLVLGLAGGSCTIETVHTAGDAGDAILWTLYYLPLESGASVAAAA